MKTCSSGSFTAAYHHMCSVMAIYARYGDYALCREYDTELRKRIGRFMGVTESPTQCQAYVNRMLMTPPPELVTELVNKRNLAMGTSALDSVKKSVASKGKGKNPGKNGNGNNNNNGNSGSANGNKGKGAGKGKGKGNNNKGGNGNNKRNGEQSTGGNNADPSAPSAKRTKTDSDE